MEKCLQSTLELGLEIHQRTVEIEIPNYLEYALLYFKHI